MPWEGDKLKTVLLGKPRPREQRGLLEVTDHWVLEQDPHRSSKPLPQPARALLSHPFIFRRCSSQREVSRFLSHSFVCVAVNGNVLRWFYTGR